MIDLVNIKSTTKCLDMEHTTQPCLEFQIIGNSPLKYNLYVDENGFLEVDDSEDNCYIEASYGNIDYIIDYLKNNSSDLTEIETQIIYQLCFSYLITYIRLALKLPKIHFPCKVDKRQRESDVTNYITEINAFIYEIFEFYKLKIQHISPLQEEFSTNLLCNEPYIKVANFTTFGVSIFVSKENYNIYLLDQQNNILGKICVYGINTSASSMMLTYSKIYLLNLTYYQVNIIYTAMLQLLSLQGIVLTSHNSKVLLDTVRRIFG